MEPVPPHIMFNVSQSSQNKPNAVNGVARNEGDLANTNTNNDIGKRKKTMNTPLNTLNQNHHRNLDEWLDNCMRDNTLMTPSLENSDPNLVTNNINAKTSRNHLSTSYTMKPNTGVLNLNNYQKYLPIYPMPQNFESSNPPYDTPPNFNNTFSDCRGDFTSLPPVGNTANQEHNGSDDFELRRFSDPCIPGTCEYELNRNSQNTQQQQQSGTNNENNVLLTTLLAQINMLHDTNAKICRNLHDTKVEIEALKHAPSWGLRHRRDSISGLSTHSQPLGYAFGTHSPAPTFHSGMYTPGMLTDVVREVKEAARVREEALLSRVRAMVEERSWTINDTNMKMIRDLEEMKVQINQFKSERTETNTRFTKMEDEIKSLRALLSHVLNSSRSNAFLSNSNSFNERDFSRSTHNVLENNRPKRHSLSLNYGTIAHDDTIGFPNENDILRPMTQQFNDIRKAEKLKCSQNVSKNNYIPTEHHNESANNNRSYNSDHMYTTPENEQSEGHIVQMEKDTLELRRELQDALASKKHAENKILALEHIVKNLQNKMTQPIDTSPGATSSRTSSLSETHSNNSPGKPQIASQIQTLTPKLLSTSTISLSGPVTDL